MKPIWIVVSLIMMLIILFFLISLVTDTPNAITNALRNLGNFSIG